MRQRDKVDKAAELITAQDIGTFAYCPEQWRLQYGLGLPSQKQAAMTAGNRHHTRKAAAERVASGFLTLGVMILAATVLFLLWLVWR